MRLSGYLTIWFIGFCCCVTGRPSTTLLKSLHAGLPSGCALKRMKRFCMRGAPNVFCFAPTDRVSRRSPRLPSPIPCLRCSTRSSAPARALPAKALTEKQTVSAISALTPPQPSGQPDYGLHRRWRCAHSSDLQVGWSCLASHDDLLHQAEQPADAPCHGETEKRAAQIATERHAEIIRTQGLQSLRHELIATDGNRLLLESDVTNSACVVFDCGICPMSAAACHVGVSPWSRERSKTFMRLLKLDIWDRRTALAADSSLPAFLFSVGWSHWPMNLRWKFTPKVRVFRVSRKKLVVWSKRSMTLARLMSQIPSRQGVSK